MQPRYFIGISLPEDITGRIQDIQTSLYEEETMLEPLVPHITLVHPNALQTLAPMYFIPKAKDAATPLLPIEITLTDIQVFHNSVAHISVSSEGLNKLHSSLLALLPKSVIAQYYTDRNYKPHVTLLQAKQRQKITPALLANLNDRLQSLLPINFTVTQISCYKWISSREYKIEKL